MTGVSVPHGPPATATGWSTRRRRIRPRSRSRTRASSTAAVTASPSTRPHQSPGGPIPRRKPSRRLAGRPMSQYPSMLITTGARVISMLGYWLIGLPASLLLGFRLGMGPPGLWWGLVLGLAVTAAVLLARVRLRLRGRIRRLLVDHPVAVAGGP